MKKAFRLQPKRVDPFKLSTDPFFIEKMRDVVGLYLNPPENALVLCVDVKSQCQALERIRPMLPLGRARWTDRQGRSGRTRCPLHRRQLRQPQASEGARLAG
jgi:hypothetical protein